MNNNPTHPQFGSYSSADDCHSIFLFVGLVTIVSVPFIYWRLDNDIPSARFLTEEEKEQAIERLRANQTGTGSTEFKWAHILEIFLEPKSYLWIAMTLLLNVGTSVTNTFGPLILQGLGFDSYTTSLLNMPFGAVQLILILLASWAAQKVKIKSAVINVLMIPVIVGLALLYVLQRGVPKNQGPLLLAYYFLAFVYGGNPLVVSWIVGNTGGTTKKSVIMSLYNAASSAGNIVGPLLFNDNDAPAYHPGLRSVLGIFIALMVVVALQAANLWVLNKMNRKSRIRAGKKADIQDHSMQDHYVPADAENADAEGHTVGAGGEADLTDGKNDEFVYIY